jgi:hypothetical protein
MAYTCTIDPKCSRFIQNRLALDIGRNELISFFNKLMLNITESQFKALVKDVNGNYIL